MPSKVDPRIPPSTIVARTRRGTGPAGLLGLGGLGVTLVVAALAVRNSNWAVRNRVRAMDLQQLESVARDRPDDFLVQYTLAKRYYLAQRFEEAAGRYAEAERISPASAQAHLGRGLSALETGNSQTAEEELTQALRLDPKLAWAEYMLGKIAWQRGEIPTALKRVERSTQLDSRSDAAWYFLGVCYIQLQRFDEGAKALSRALEHHERDARYHTALAELMVYRGQTDEGRRHYERALQIDPDFGPACALMGSLYLHKMPGPDSLSHAEDLLGRAARLKTYHPSQVHLDLGELYLQKADYKRSVDALRTSVQLDPRDERPYFTLAKAYRRLGDAVRAAEAERTFQAISINHIKMQTLEARVFHNPGSADAHLQLARTYRDLGLLQQSTQQYLACLQIQPGSREIAAEFQSALAQPTSASRHSAGLDLALPPVH